MHLDFVSRGFRRDAGIGRRAHCKGKPIVRNSLPWNPEHFTETPVVSVILFCKNAAKTLTRSVESVAAQTYKNFEYVVQDAGSTDGTTEIIQRYANAIDVRLVSEPDRGPADGFWRALQRCRGRILATCLADEELLPDALEYAVKVFAERPYLGALTGDAYNTDAKGRVLSTHKSGPFSFVRYVAAEYCPYWSSSFFSMQALKLVGILDRRWSSDSLEFEIWCRLAKDNEIMYAPKIFSKYSIHPAQLSNFGERAMAELSSRLQIMRDHVFRPTGVFGADAEAWREQCILLQRVNLLEHLLPYGGQALDQLRQDIEASPALRNFLSAKQRGDTEVLGAADTYQTILRRLYGNVGLQPVFYLLLGMYKRAIPPSLRASISPDLKRRIKRLFRVARIP